eukprot:363681-Chlamydomonas_euryale.AAC.4
MATPTKKRQRDIQPSQWCLHRGTRGLNSSSQCTTPLATLPCNDRGRSGGRSGGGCSKVGMLAQFAWKQPPRGHSCMVPGCNQAPTCRVDPANAAAQRTCKHKDKRKTDTHRVEMEEGRRGGA